MVLELEINITEDADCKGWEFFETTGAYSAANKTGWDEGGAVAGIPATTDATGATLTIVHPDGTTTSTIDVSASFPTTDSTQAFAIANTDLGLASDASIPSGVYKVTYSLDTTGEVEAPHSKTCYILFKCTVSCCVDKMFGQIPNNDCDTCQASKLAMALEADAYICAAVKALGCDKITDAQLHIDKANFMCANNECKC